ncbi:hypothetical protein KAU33_13925 [Candidatus Dependentiae bacterium]|nr:hypothetical protein [Candidatus Dependentiae bacterium]
MKDIKGLRIFVLIFLVCLLFSTTTTSEQVPLLETFQLIDIPKNTTWNSTGAGCCYIIQEDGIYKMWFTASDGLMTRCNYSLAYTTSTDGLNWTNPQVIKKRGSYTIFWAPTVLKEGDSYWVYYTNYYTSVFSQWSHYIALGKSTDGITFSSDELVLKGSGVAFQWDARDIKMPCIMKEGGEYIMYFATRSWGNPVPTNPLTYIGRATSYDGINWTNKQIMIDEYDIQYYPGSVTHIQAPTVLKEEDGTYTMFFCFSHHSNEYARKVSTVYKTKSPDGINWEKPKIFLDYPDFANLDSGYQLTRHSYPFYFKDANGKKYLFITVYNEILGEHAIARVELGESGDPPPPPPPPPDEIVATVDVDPDTLHLGSEGKPITVYIELPEEYNIYQIDVNSILLNSQVYANPIPVEINDYDSDGILDLKVQFNRKKVQDILVVGKKIKITITGKVGTENFIGVDYIKVINPSLKVHAYPNPCKKSSGPSVLSIKVKGKLDTDAILKIYTLSGEFITEIPLKGGASTAYWYLKNKAGKKVSSGTYIYCLLVNGQIRDTGKFVVVK